MNSIGAKDKKFGPCPSCLRGSKSRFSCSSPVKLGILHFLLFITKDKYLSFPNPYEGPKTLLYSHKKEVFPASLEILSMESEKSSISKGKKIGMDCATKKRGKLCGKKECEHCFKRCFASCEKSKYLAEGQQDPFLIVKHSHEKLSFACPMCDHVFEMRVYDVAKMRWCPFCTNQKLCASSECEMCFKKSFASHPKAECWSYKNKRSAREIFLYSDNKVWFDCDVCIHDFEAAVKSASKGSFCPYCPKPPKKLCASSECEMCFKKSFASHEKAKCWSDKNEKTARESFLYSNKKVWFDCEKKHEFQDTVCHVSSGRWCPKCKHKTEALVFEFLKEHFKDPIHQFKVSWCKNPETNKYLPFDFCVSNTILEIDGAQHYKQVMNWKSPEEQQKSDRYKEGCALKNNYSVLRILQEDVWNNKMDWKKLLLEHIKDYETPVVIRLWEKETLSE
ncbi:restriction endonuclease [Brazilian marseillevirus]|uniref:restriction endonuclease n=1 Tax=Brazilian marseillevirus TaxID=1813599 RepID=UPI000784F3E5|nr:restriction endonuclease [Brazilian marseillevirus]AMQ10582.1 restriction endonuclease [Brazilian marseillevirus]